MSVYLKKIRLNFGYITVTIKSLCAREVYFP